MALAISISDVAFIPGFVKIGLLLRKLYCFKTCKGVTQAGWKSKKPTFLLRFWEGKCVRYEQQQWKYWRILLSCRCKGSLICSLQTGLPRKQKQLLCQGWSYYAIVEHQAVEPGNPSICYRNRRRYCSIKTEIFILHNSIHDNRNASWRSQRCLIPFF
jgi:hypothetical protein